MTVIGRSSYDGRDKGFGHASAQPEADKNSRTIPALRHPEQSGGAEENGPQVTTRAETRKRLSSSCLHPEALLPKQMARTRGSGQPGKAGHELTTPLRHPAGGRYAQGRSPGSRVITPPRLPKPCGQVAEWDERSPFTVAGAAWELPDFRRVHPVPVLAHRRFRRRTLNRTQHSADSIFINPYVSRHRIPTTCSYLAQRPERVKISSKRLREAGGTLGSGKPSGRAASPTRITITIPMV